MELQAPTTFVMSLFVLDSLSIGHTITFSFASLLAIFPVDIATVTRYKGALAPAQHGRHILPPVYTVPAPAAGPIQL